MNINVIINGKPRSIEGGISLLALLRLLDIDPGRVAIEYNRDIVERNQFGSICLKEDDKLEIITFVGGGAVGPEGHILRGVYPEPKSRPFVSLRVTGGEGLSAER